MKTKEISIAVVNKHYCSLCSLFKTCESVRRYRYYLEKLEELNKDFDDLILTVTVDCKRSK